MVFEGDSVSPGTSRLFPGSQGYSRRPGTLLDNCMIRYGSHFTDGTSTQSTHLPMSIAGAKFAQGGYWITLLS